MRIRGAFLGNNSSQGPAELDKPYARGVVSLTSTIDPVRRIGPITQNHWLHPAVSGVRIRIGWEAIEPIPGGYDWSLLDECMAHCTTSGKWIGLGMSAGTGTPGHVMGGQRFSDGVVATGSDILTSATANFVIGDVGRGIKVPREESTLVGGKIIERISATQAKLSITSSNTQNGLIFWVLGRNPGGSAYFSIPNEGNIPVIWDTVFRDKWDAFVTKMADRYDDDDRVRYMAIGGPGRTGEYHYCDNTAGNFEFLDTNATNAGYTPGGGLNKAASVAWREATKHIHDHYAAVFTKTQCMMTSSNPFVTPSAEGDGPVAMTQVQAHSVTNHAGKVGFMFSFLKAITTNASGEGKVIYDNRLTHSGGAQFVSNSQQDGNPPGNRLSNSTPWGPDPYLGPLGAMTATCNACVSIYGRFMETYDLDLKDGSYSTLLANTNTTLLGLT